jgi:ABC-type polysaccharide/polyol phosphate transport system ATPase subunit/MoaA/NifB/PqqE/SkfB family radical SAM enzyme
MSYNGVSAERTVSLNIQGKTFLVHPSLLSATYPQTLSLESTNLCNLSCSHCKRSLISEFSKGHFDMSLLGKVEHLVGGAISSVSLSDYGEPLLSKVWDELLAWALAHKGVQISFTTNGLLLEGQIEKVMDHRISIAVSVDGVSEETYGYFRGKGNFERLYGNLRLLDRVKRERGVSYPVVSFFFTVSRVNCHELERMVELAKEVGAVTVVVQFQLFFDRKRFEAESVASLPEDYDRHIAAARRRAAELGIFLIHPDSFDGQSVISRDNLTNSWLGRNPDGSIQCFAQRAACYVKYNGIVEACCSLGHLVMGDLNLDSFEDIWHGPLYRELRLAFGRKEWPQRCAQCNLIQSIDSRDERAHYISLDGVPAEGTSIRQRYRITDVEQLYQKAIASLPDHRRAFEILNRIIDVDKNLYEVSNLAACLSGFRGEMGKMHELLERCRLTAPHDLIIQNNNEFFGMPAQEIVAGGSALSDSHAIKIDHLIKRYRLYNKPSARLKELFFRQRCHSEFTALHDVSFRVRKGETFGIIGENGAGKSTLLKIISGTLKQTEGEVNIQGRVSSLLELGSGFHPEFTGIDNIYFYGSLLGISASEMKKRIEYIIAFAEVGEHIHYPLRTYSSGMYVRLAFSVAMAVDPDILVVDEALSVGDLYFQKKSTEKILSFKERGKTIVFCSHSMYYINRLCDRVIWLKNGAITMQGAPHEVTQAYETYQLKKAAVKQDSTVEERLVSASTSLVLIRNILVTPFPTVRSGDDLNIEIEINVFEDSLPYTVAAILKRVDGIEIIGIGTKEYAPFFGNRVVTLRFPSIQLKEGTFFVEVYTMDEQFVHIYDRKVSTPFTVPKESVELGFLNIPYEWII